jgi:hypothetical protein
MVRLVTRSQDSGIATPIMEPRYLTVSQAGNEPGDIVHNRLLSQ